MASHEVALVQNIGVDAKTKYALKRGEAPAGTDSIVLLMPEAVPTGKKMKFTVSINAVVMNE